jgi:hypothetical protein
MNDGNRRRELRGTPVKPPSFSVTPSYAGAQWTIENIRNEQEGWKSDAKKRGEALRARNAALKSALAAPLEAAPHEHHAAALLGTKGYHRLARSLARIRRPTSPSDPEAIR